MTCGCGRALSGGKALQATMHEVSWMRDPMRGVRLRVLRWRLRPTPGDGGRTQRRVDIMSGPTHCLRLWRSLWIRELLRLLRPL